MKNGWTGGQYSLFRALFGAYLLIHFFPNVLALDDAAWMVTALNAIAACASVAFILGIRDRIAAVVILSVLACLFGRNPLIGSLSLPFIGWMLLAHALLPRAPFGSWDARGRTDPRGGWSFPAPLFAASWIVMAAGYTYSGWTKVASSSWVDGTVMARVALALELLFAPLALIRRARPVIWTLMLMMQIGLMIAIDSADLSFAMILLHLFTFDPRWVPGTKPGTVDDVFYDGTCGLCHRSTRFLIAEDPEGTAFRYAPLGGDAFLARVGDRSDLPDSIVVRNPDGTLLVKSDAALHLGRRLGGYWRVLATVAGLIPRALLNRAYDFVARIRYRLFARPKEACPMLPPDLRKRFSA